MTHTTIYHDLIADILISGTDKEDRTKTGTKHLFGRLLKFNLQDGFPLITTREINYKAVFNEFVWMICKGSNEVSWLEKRGHKFWNPWKLSNGTIGKGYGYQFRQAYGNLDQVKQVLFDIRNNPTSRRHVITTWNPSELHEMALPPCHGLIVQFNVRDGKLDLCMYQRSADAFLGLSWNIPFYALFCHVVGHLSDLEVGELTIMLGDVHLYRNHIDQAKLLLSRDPEHYIAPTLSIDLPMLSIDNIDIQHFKLNNYQHYPAISAEVAV